MQQLLFDDTFKNVNFIEAPIAPENKEKQNYD